MEIPKIKKPVPEIAPGKLLKKPPEFLADLSPPRLLKIHSVVLQYKS